MRRIIFTTSIMKRIRIIPRIKSRIMFRIRVWIGKRIIVTTKIRIVFRISNEILFRIMLKDYI